MRILLPVINIDRWEFEPFIIFDSCLKCGAVRKVESLGRLIAGKQKKKCWTASCNCQEIITLTEAIEEENLIEVLTALDIDHGQSI